jgi:hypothetical protein
MPTNRHKLSAEDVAMVTQEVSPRTRFEREMERCFGASGCVPFRRVSPWFQQDDRCADVKRQSRAFLRSFSGANCMC